MGGKIGVWMSAVVVKAVQELGSAVSHCEKEGVGSPTVVSGWGQRRGLDLERD
jgi:hypothetical protein